MRWHPRGVRTLTLFDFACTWFDEESYLDFVAGRVHTRSRSCGLSRSGRSTAFPLLRVALDSGDDNFAQVGRDFGFIEACKQSLALSEPMLYQRSRELQVLLPTRDILRDREIMDFEAQASDAVCIGVQDAHQSLAPPAR
jgi:hypothetical protein